MHALIKKLIQNEKKIPKPYIQSQYLPMHLSRRKTF